MKELVVVSGKGGTGKTSISAALAALAAEKVLVDCDVDAANFHLLTSAVCRESYVLQAGFEPYIEEKACTSCGKCTDLCRFGAISAGVISVPLNCEGCGVCAFNCPEQAITMKEREAGHWFISDTCFGQMVHAELGLAVENSGKLVSKVRQEAKNIAIKKKVPLLIIDGPPGIGCPAIAALSGASLALAVVEPTVSGIHDLGRLAELTEHFQMPLAVVINKSTLHEEKTKQIEIWCEKKGFPVYGRLPYSDTFRQAVQRGKTIMEMADGSLEDGMRKIWQCIAQKLELPEGKSKFAFLRKINLIKKGRI